MKGVQVRGDICMFDMSSGEHTPLGWLLRRMYYSTDVCDLVRDFKTGYPHNGGQHTFHWKGPWREALAFLELLDEVMHDKFKSDKVVCQVASELCYISQEIHAKRRGRTSL